MSSPASTRVSLVLVGYRSAAVTGDAVRSFRTEAARCGIAGEVIVVDHSEDAGELERLEALGADRLVARPNRGYAAGINAGLAMASGEWLLVGNPDIELRPGALMALLDALGQGFDVVGPQFTQGPWLFPPGDRQAPSEELRRWWACRGMRRWRRHFRRELAGWRSVWFADRPVPRTWLSGALIAFHRSVLEAVGSWDEGYFLYFEETDWLLRAVAAGLRVAFVPGARVEHHWGYSANPVACGGHYVASRSRFFRQRFGPVGGLVISFGIRPTPLRLSAWTRDHAMSADAIRQWLLSPAPQGFPAAGMVGTEAQLDEGLALVESARGGRDSYTLMCVEHGGDRVLGAWQWGG